MVHVLFYYTDDFQFLTCLSDNSIYLNLPFHIVLDVDTQEFDYFLLFAFLYTFIYRAFSLCEVDLHIIINHHALPDQARIMFMEF